MITLPIKGKLANRIIFFFLHRKGWFDFSGDYSFQAAKDLGQDIFLRVGMGDETDSKLFIDLWNNRWLRDVSR